MSKSPFDYLNSVNFTKVDIFEDEKSYPSWMVRQGLSYFPDTIHYTNEMNFYWQTDGKMQYHFFLHGLRKRKRFSKWFKKTENKDLDLIKEYFGYSQDKALEALEILTQEQIKTIRKKLSKGGTK